MHVQYKKIETIPEFIDAIRSRVDVFIIEQKCPPGWEPDELDKVSQQFIAVTNHKIIATARLREDAKGIAKLERMVVTKKFRGKGIASDLTIFIVDEARKQGYKRIWLQAQEHAKSVYEKAGFKVISSKPYDLWNLGIPHVDMEIILE